MGYRAICLHTSASNPALNSSDRQLLPTDAGSTDYLKFTDGVSLASVGKLLRYKSHIYSLN